MGLPEKLYYTMEEVAIRWNTRDKIGEFTGGAFSPRYMANLDCRQEGVPNSFKVGRRQCNQVTGIWNWTRVQKILLRF